jgi:surface protein
MAELKRINGTPLVIAGRRSGVLYDRINKETTLDVRFFEMIQDTTLTPSGLGYVNFTECQGTEIGWGDANFFVVTNNLANNISHTYASPGQYRIRAVGSYVARNNDADGGLVDITRWDNFDFTDAAVFGGLEGGSFATVSASGGPTGFRGTGTLNLNELFSGCTNFTGGIGAWTFDNTRVYNLLTTFNNCTSFNEDLSGWSTMRPSNMNSTFSNCSAFNSSVQNWDLSQCTSLLSTFSGCSIFNQPLTTWDVSQVTNFSGMFNGCSAFNGDISNWQIRNDGTPVNMSLMFRSTGDFAGDISTDAVNGYWVMSDVTNVSDMFEFSGPNCNPTMNNWDLSNCTNMQDMFNAAGGAFQGNGCDTWTINTTTPVTTSGMFSSCTAFNADITGWDVSQFSSVVMFIGCESFNRDLSSWAVTASNVGPSMFSNCTVFNAGLGNGVSGTRLSGWNLTGYTGSMASMFSGARAFNQDISAWTVSGVTNMSNMFNTAQRFNQDISGWNTGNVQTMQTMFNNAQDFDQPIGSWNVTSCSNFQQMFRLNNVFDQNLGGWTLTAASNMTSMAGNLSTANKALTWIGWESNSPNTGINFTGTFGGTFSKTATTGVDGYDGQSMYRAINSLVAPTPATSRSSGTTTSTTASKLVDSGANFVSSGVQVGDLVTNSTDTTHSYVTAVDSATTLSLNDDIFVSGEAYDVSGGYGATITGVSF